MRHLFRAFLRFIKGATWKKGHFEHKVLMLRPPWLFDSIYLISIDIDVMLDNNIFNNKPKRNKEEKKMRVIRVLGRLQV